jgi:molecular chaperone DnaK (HSP70)
MGRAVGIDLGTTNSVAAIKEGTVKVLQNRENQDLTPSVVGMHKKQEIVGQFAVDRALISPKDTVYSVKRLMGRGMRDPQVQEFRNRYPYDVVEPADGTDDDVRVIIDGKEYSPPQVSAMILRKIKADAEIRLNDSVEYAVITVPAYFSEKQKDATRRAGQLAGLKVQKILTEPTAAAIAFGIDNVGPDDSKTILVYDMGGGTFDVSVLTIVGGIFAELCVEGDMWLGGDDFDHRIIEHVVQHIEAIHGIDPRKDPRFMVALKAKAEQAKKSLSSLTRTDITIPGMLKSPEGDLIDIEIDLSRAEFERMIAKRVDESIDLVRTAIKNAGETMTPDQIDHVLLVGGSSCIPLVRKSLAAVFGEPKLMMNIDPMKCVAYGAAILSAKWAEKVECPNGHVNPGKNHTCEVASCGLPLNPTDGPELPLEVTPMHYGILAKGDRFEIIIPKGTAFPTQDPFKERFVTPRANLRRIKVPILAGSAAHNELQATVWLELPENVAAGTPLEVVFRLDGDGILEKVKVGLLDGSGSEVETYLDRGNTVRSRLEKKLDQLKKKKDDSGSLGADSEGSFEAAYGRATKALSANDAATAAKCVQELEAILATTGGSSDEPEWARKADGLCGWVERVIEYGFLLDPPRLQRIKTLKDQLQACIDRSDEAATRQKFEELDKATDDLPPQMYVLLGLRRSRNDALAKNMDVEADQIQAALNSIEGAMRKGDDDRALQLLEQIDPVMTKVKNTAKATAGGSSSEDYAEKG